MKINFFLTMILILISTSIVAEKIEFSGINESQFVYRDLKDSKVYDKDYKSYFQNELSVSIYKGKLRAGFKIDFFQPEYDKYIAVENAGNEENIFDLDEYYLQYETDNTLFKLGTLEAAFGSGICLHSYLDDDFNQDKRTNGFYSRTDIGSLQFQFISGILDNDENDIEYFTGDFDLDLYDKLIGADVKYRVNDFITFGISGNQFKENQTTLNNVEDYSTRNLFGGRITLSQNIFEWATEIASSKEKDNANSPNEDIEGTAIYSNFSMFFEKITFIGAYKNYENFNHKLSDLPTANYSGEPLTHGHDIGEDEEGFMGEISYMYDFDNEFLFNYGEGWNSNFKIRCTDFYSEYKRSMENFNLMLDYAHFESINKKENFKNWERKLKPAMQIDFVFNEMPFLMKAEYEIINEKDIDKSIEHVEPRIQTDIGFNDFSFSITIENQIGDALDDGLEDNDGKFWVGCEITGPIINNIDFRFFAGQEKAGLVCRNGVCKQQAAFSGLKLEITTTF